MPLQTSSVNENTRTNPSLDSSSLSNEQTTYTNNLNLREQWQIELSINKNKFPLDPIFKSFFKKFDTNYEEWKNFRNEIKQIIPLNNAFNEDFIDKNPIDIDNEPIFISFFKNFFLNNDFLFPTSRRNIKRRLNYIQSEIKSDYDKDSETSTSLLTPSSPSLSTTLSTSNSKATLVTPTVTPPATSKATSTGDIKEFLIEFKNFIRIPYAQLLLICEELKISKFDEEILIMMCEELIKYNDITYKTYLCMLKSSPSRYLLSTILKIAHIKSKPLVYGLLLPLIKQPPEIDLVPNHLEQQQYEGEDEGVSKRFEDWDDAMIDIYISIFSQKFQLLNEPEEILSRFLKYLDFNIEQKPENQKLGQLMMIIVTKHSNDIMEMLQELKDIIEKTKSYFKRIVLVHLNKLMNNQV
ncbi:10970_t:CDS:2 [Entrophospora sp. SA101]|nr:10970_t:CDS:2 [Entrophospora sp. SA101]